MSDTIATAYVEIRPDKDSIGKFQSDTESELHPRASALGASTGKILGLGIAAGIGGGAVALGATLKTGFGEVKDYQEGLSQLTAGIKSTGGAAGVTAPQLEALATKIQGYSGQTDDSIVASEKLLLTFTNIKNSGPDKIFDQATKATADMAARMGGDASGAAIQLGKALNDPVKGISALSRVGVSFTDSQKEMIKHLVATGDTMGAQKIILKELNSEFGGSAEAFGKTLPGQMAIAKRSFEDISQNLVTALMPAITGVLKFVVNDLIPGMATLGEFLERTLGPAFRAVGDVIGKVFGAFKTDGISGALSEVGQLVSDFLPVLGAKLEELGKAFVAWIGPQIQPMLSELGTLAGKMFDWLVDVGLPALITKLAEWAKAFVAWVAPLIPPLLVELVKIELKIDEWLLTDALPKILVSIGKLALAFIEWVAPALVQLLVEVGKLEIALLGWLGGLPRKAAEKAADLAVKLYDWVGPAALSLMTEVGKLELSLIGWVGGLPGKIASKLSGLASGAFDGIKNAFRDAINWIIDRWNGLSFSMPSVDTHIPGVGTVGGFSIGTPNIPRLADGGVVKATPGGRLALLGEAGRDEAVIPLTPGRPLAAPPLDLKELVSEVREMRRSNERLEQQFARQNDRFLTLARSGAIPSMAGV